MNTQVRPGIFLSLLLVCGARTALTSRNRLEQTLVPCEPLFHVDTLDGLLPDRDCSLTFMPQGRWPSQIQGPRGYCLPIPTPVSFYFGELVLRLCVAFATQACESIHESAAAVDTTLDQSLAAAIFGIFRHPRGVGALGRSFISRFRVRLQARSMVGHHIDLAVEKVLRQSTRAAEYVVKCTSTCRVPQRCHNRNMDTETTLLRARVMPTNF